MPLNRDRIGTEYPSYTYEVSREKIREYAAALGETDPRYFSDGDDCVAPPTFAACFTIIKGGQAMFTDAGLGAHPALVHGAQSFEFGDEPLRPGDVVECTPRIADITSKGRNEFLTLEVDCRRQGSGDRAVLSRGTIVFLGSAPQRESTGDAEVSA
ncbi:MAG: MaoC family dehydratase N-terminal domain-containing protein [Actinobacteria bacterium]|nr:MaoC family dehydratase N-terminal domain-containing protein [Actinomycetota bacterium]